MLQVLKLIKSCTNNSKNPMSEILQNRSENAMENNQLPCASNKCKIIDLLHNLKSLIRGLATEGQIVKDNMIYLLKVIIHIVGFECILGFENRYIRPRLGLKHECISTGVINGQVEGRI